jgi:hypothetical protein
MHRWKVDGAGEIRAVLLKLRRGWWWETSPVTIMIVFLLKRCIELYFDLFLVIDLL